MPPADLITLVSGTPEQRWFSARGQADVANLKDMLRVHGRDLAGPIAMLDWGCGCGRTARWLAPEVMDAGGTYVGCDIGSRLVSWCGENLPGRYFVNRLEPPLDLESGVLDLVYGHSVLTHLRELSVKAWLAEVRRILRRGGLAVLTFHDEQYAARWAPEGVSDRLVRQNFVVWNDALEGSNYLSAWTTAQHLRSLCEPAFQVLEVRPGRQDIPEQAIIVLQAA